jgi:Tol biopolymer transport system component
LKTVRERLSELSGSGASAVIEAKPRRGLAWMAVVAAFLAGTAAAWLWFRSRAPRPRPAPIVRPLTYTGRDYSPAVSPDGKTMAFVSDRDGKKRVWLRQIQGGGEQPLTEGPDDDYPRFSPDGSSILFVRTSRETPAAIYRQSLVGGELRRVAENAVSADWSPDGRQIAFIRWGLDGQRAISQIWLTAPDGSGAREIHRAGDQLAAPRFSPDARRLAMFILAQGGPGSRRRRSMEKARRRTGVGAFSSAAWSGTTRSSTRRRYGLGRRRRNPGMDFLPRPEDRKTSLFFVPINGY